MELKTETPSLLSIETGLATARVACTAVAVPPPTSRLVTTVSPGSTCLIVPVWEANTMAPEAAAMGAMTKWPAESSAGTLSIANSTTATQRMP